MVKISAGIKTYMPLGRGSRVYARSSLPTKANLMIANSVAVFDADFRGEYLMQFYNYTNKIVQHPAYTRLAQIEFFPYLRASKKFGTAETPEIEFIVDAALYENFAETFESERGAGGIGSTG
ncbi:MAG: hypothetical protein LBI53_06100 [Candidatus Peribacteria bacterium]|nr:hypothetical protein [Candidatus Peribacteria bacterium]